MNISEIEKRCEKASGGKWTRELSQWDISSKRYQVVCNGSPICTMPTEEPGSRRNAEFIAHAREDIPALIAHVRELERQVKEMEADARRLDWLELMANLPGGLLLHDGTETGRLGLGLRPGQCVRTLREAIDDALNKEQPNE